MKEITTFLKKILLAVELGFVIALVNWDKLLFVGIIALDQFVKAKIISTMVPGESIPVLQNVFHITYVLNPGAAFGILPNQRIFFLVAGGILLILAAYFYPKINRKDTLSKFGAIILVSGATANLIDRVQSGLVIDFLDFRVFPVFNIADIAIVVGMFVMVYVVLFKMETESGGKIETL